MSYQISNMIGGGNRYPRLDSPYGYQDKAASTSNSSSYTFNSINFGPAAANRLLVVAGTMVEDDPNNHGFQENNTTINGVQVTIHDSVGPQQASGHYLGAAIMSAHVPNDTSGQVILKFGGAILGCHFSLYSLLDLESHTPIFAGSQRGSSTNRSDTVPTKEGGIIIAASAFNPTGRSCSWSGVNEDHDSDSGEDSYSAGHLIDTRAGSENVQASWSGGSSAISLTVGSWR